MIRQLGRFASIGVLATLIHVSVALAVQSLLGAAPQAANFAGFAAAVAFSYFGHLHVSFGVTPAHFEQAPRFAVTALAGLAASSAITAFMVDVMGQSFAIAMLAVGVLVPIQNFAALKLWTFSEAPARPQIRDLETGVILSALFSLALAAFMWDRPINHDTQWYLIATEKWLSGAVLYGDIIEVNPPLNFYYTVPAVLIAQLTGIAAQNAQYIVTSALTGGSLAWVWLLLSRAGVSDRHRIVAYLAAVAGVTLPFLSEFAQREHTLVILMMPWIFGKLLEREENRQTMGRGEIARAAFAAFGICIKPYFLLYPVILTLVDIGKARSLRPVWSTGNLTIAAICIAYLAGAFVVHPLYFSDIVPIARQVYGANGFPKDIVLLPFSLLETVLLALALFVGLIAHRKDPALLRLAALTLAAVAIYLIQFTGFLYQFFPTFSFALLGVAWALTKSGLSPAIRGLSALAIAGFLRGVVSLGTYQASDTETIAQAVMDNGGSERLMSFTTSLRSGPGVTTFTGSAWVSGYPALWFVPGAVNGLANTDCLAHKASCAAWSAALDRTRRDLATELAAQKPDMLIFDFANGLITDPEFSWAGFVSEDPELAELVSEYSPVFATRRFEIYRRSAP